MSDDNACMSGKGAISEIARILEKPTGYSEHVIRGWLTIAIEDTINVALNKRFRTTDSKSPSRPPAVPRTGKEGGGMSNTISREAAVKILVNELDGDDYENDAPLSRCIERLRLLPAAPAPQPWTEEELADAFADTEHATIVYRERYKAWHLTPEHGLRLARVALARPLARPVEGE